MTDAALPPPRPRGPLRERLFGGQPLLTVRLPRGVPLEIGIGVPALTLGLWLVFAAMGAPTTGLVLATVFFGTILAHELGHALGAWMIGTRVQRLTVNGLTGQCTVDEIHRRGAAIWFFFSGPLVHLVIGVPSVVALFLMAGPIVEGKEVFYVIAPDVAAVLEMVVGLNLILLVINLLPVLPHDGGHILRLALGAMLAERVALRVAGAIGLMLAAVAPLVAVALWWHQGIFLPLILPVRMSWHLLRNGQVPTA